MPTRCKPGPCLPHKENSESGSKRPEGRVKSWEEAREQKWVLMKKSETGACLDSNSREPVTTVSPLPLLWDPSANCGLCLSIIRCACRRPLACLFSSPGLQIQRKGPQGGANSSSLGHDRNHILGNSEQPEYIVHVGEECK